MKNYISMLALACGTIAGRKGIVVFNPNDEKGSGKRPLVPNEYVQEALDRKLARKFKSEEAGDLDGVDNSEEAISQRLAENAPDDDTFSSGGDTRDTMAFQRPALVDEPGEAAGPTGEGSGEGAGTDDDDAPPGVNDKDDTPASATQASGAAATADTVAKPAAGGTAAKKATGAAASK